MSSSPQAFRPFWALAPIGLMYLASLLRLLSLQGHISHLDAGDYVRRNTVLPAARGSILDCNGLVLAEDVNTWDLVVNYRLQDRSLVQALQSGKRSSEEVEARLRLLAEGLDFPLETLREALMINPNAAQTLRRGISPAMRESFLRTLRRVPGSGLALLQKFNRIYPNGAVLSHVIGIPAGTGAGATPGIGLERGLEDLLASCDGYRRSLGVSSKHGVNPALDMQAPQPGQSVKTTLDLELSTFAYAELGNLMQQHEAEHCFAIAIDVRGGQILTMLGLPDYDPNDPLASMEMRSNPYSGKEEANGWMFPGIGHVEPGSTFKPLVAAYALDRGAIGEQQRFENFDGSYCPPHRLRKHTIHNAPGVPLEPMRAFEAIVYSSNVVFSQIARAIGREGMASILDNFGYHDHPYALPGLAFNLQPRKVPPHADFFRERSPDGLAYTIPTMGYGQGFDVPPLDHVMALASIANGGILLTPTLDPRASGTTVRRVLSEASTAYVRKAMHGMVMLPQRRWLPHREELNYCGKSGTAKIRYGPFEGQYTSLYTAFGPLEDPQVLVLVVAFGTHYSGRGGPHHYGSKVCGPVAANILFHALQGRGLVATKSAESLEWRASAANLRSD